MINRIYPQVLILIITLLAITSPSSAASTYSTVRSTTHVLSGKVIDRHNTPIAGATVHLLPFRYSSHERQSISIPDNQFPTTQTDAHGSFTLIRQVQEYPNILVRSEGFMDKLEPLSSSGSSLQSPPTSITLTVHRASPLSGIVADDAGLPLPGVTVTANPATINDQFTGPQTTYEKTQTDGDGRFSLANVPDAPVALRFSCPGFADAYRTVEPGEPIAVNLNRGATVTGSVVDLDGQPVPRVSITLSAMNRDFNVENQGKPKPFPRQWNQNAVSGESGAISFRNVPAGEYVISVPQNSQNPSKYGIWSPGTNFISLTVPENEPPSSQIVRVFSGYTIKGRVIEQGTTNTIAGAKIWLQYYSHPHPWTTSDNSGAFTFEGIFAQSQLQLTAEAEGFRAVRPNSSWGNTTVTVTAELPTSSALVEVTIPLEREKQIRGVVIDATTSQPVSGATVRTVEQHYHSERPNDTDPTAVTGPDGRFTLHSYIGESIRLRAELPGYAPSISEPLSTLTDEIILIMHQGRELHGIVLDPENKPYAGAQVSGSITIGRSSTANEFKRRYSENIPGNTVSATDGTFVLSHLPPYANVVITATADAFARSEPAAHYVPKDKDITSVTLRLRVAKNLAGRVLSPDGQPLAQARVYLPASGQGMSFTQADGRYQFKNLPDIPVEVHIHHNQHGNEHFYDIAVGRDNVDLQFGKGDKDGQQRRMQQQQEAMKNRRTGATLYGRVMDYKTNAVIEDYKVVASYGGTVKPNPDVVGGFIVEGLLIGSPYQTIQITAPGYAPYDSGSLYLMPGQSRIEKTFKLGPGGSVTGRAVDQATKQPVPGVIVSLGEDLYSANRLPDSQKPVPVATGSDGIFTLPAVGQGRKVISYEPPPETGYIKMTQEVDVIYNEATDVGDVEFGSGGTIKGKLVRMPGSIPIPGARIEARDLNPTTTNADGEFEFTNLLNGLYHVEAPEYGANSWIGIDKLETKELTLEVGSGKLTGTILRADKPVSCRIMLRRDGPGQSVSHSASTDDAGMFIIEGLAPGRWGAQISSTAGGGFTAGDYVIMPPSGENVEKTFHLPSGALRVTVVDNTGQPMPQATVTVRQQTSADSALQAQHQVAATGTNGTVAFEALDGGTYAITATTENGLRGTKDNVAIENGQSASETVTLEPAAGGSLISTTLNLSNGKPLATAWCYLFNENGQLFEHNSQRDEMGVMTIENIPPGNYRVQVSAFSYSAVEHTVTINSGEAQTLQDVLYPAGAVRWVLRDAAGAPVVGADCTLTPADPDAIESTRSGKSDAEGMFIARGLMPGAYTATARTANGLTATAPVNISAANASDVVSMVK